MKAEIGRRQYTLGNRLWQTDVVQGPRGRYSMLHARVVPRVAGRHRSSPNARGLRHATAETKALIEGLRAHHSIAHSRRNPRFEFSPASRIS